MSVPADARRAALARIVTAQIARGRRVETHDAFQAVLVRGRLLERRELLQVDDQGEVTIIALPVDRERVVLLVGVAVVLAAFLIYAIVSGSSPSERNNRLPEVLTLVARSVDMQGFGS